MKITFLLKQAETTKEIPIEFRISSGIIKGTRTGEKTTKDGKTEKVEIPIYYDIRRSTGLLIKSGFWNDKKQEVRDSFKEVVIIENETIYKRDIINNRLSDIKTFVEKLTKNDAPTIEILKHKLDVFFNKEKEETPEKMDFFSFAEKIINEHHSSKRKVVLNQCLKLIREFTENTKYRIDFETITIDFYNKLQKYMIEVKNYAQNNRSKNIKSLKYFMNEALDRELHKNLAFKTRKFSAPEETIRKIYLNDSEIDLLFRLDLSDKPRLDRVRDLFLVGCYTGLRFSDFTQIQPENIKGSIISIRAQKVHTYVKIPIKPQLKQIIEKYNGGTPKPMTNQKFNDYLKELAQLAGLNELIMEYKTKGNISKKETKPKWTLVCTHTARRSFATNCYKAGIPTKSIMLITGHSTEKEFFKYIGITEEENAEMLLNHPYFSGLRAV